MTNLTKEQQAKHDYWMQRLTNPYEHSWKDIATREQFRDELSTAIAQLCAKADSTEQILKINAQLLEALKDMKYVQDSRSHMWSYPAVDKKVSSAIAAAESLTAAPLNPAQQEAKPVAYRHTWADNSRRALSWTSYLIGGERDTVTYPLYDAPTDYAALQSQLSTAQEENAQHKEMLETLRMKLADCGVAPAIPQAESSLSNMEIIQIAEESFNEEENLPGEEMFIFAKAIESKVCQKFSEASESLSDGKKFTFQAGEDL